jgi:CHASE3 domain sensor protein
MDAKKPQVGKSDVAVTTLDRLLTKLRPVVIVGTILVLCLAVYAMAWVLSRR